jgi:rhodanese-related sulfurtransferase
MVFVLPPDYESRVRQFGLASPDEIKASLAKPDTFVLDVRTTEEIATMGQLGFRDVVQTECTPEDCPQLSLNPEKIIPDKMTANIVIYCRSGRRAAKAKEILVQQGYLGHIWNAGGYDDVVAILGIE